MPVTSKAHREQTSHPQALKAVKQSMREPFFKIIEIPNRVLYHLQ